MFIPVQFSKFRYIKIGSKCENIKYAFYGNCNTRNWLIFLSYNFWNTALNQITTKIFFDFVKIESNLGLELLQYSILVATPVEIIAQILVCYIIDYQFFIIKIGGVWAVIIHDWRISYLIFKMTLESISSSTLSVIKLPRQKY